MADPEICTIHDCTKKLNPDFKTEDVKEEEKAFPLSLWICPECEAARSLYFKEEEFAARPAA
jgi:hypothetical protein